MELEFEVEDSESLSHLEERIVRAVEMVGKLHEDNSALRKQLAEAAAERDKAVRDAKEATMLAAKSAGELESLRGERKQVRTRIEKLLGQMDLLSSAS